jgi:hypothetical protein
MAACYSLAESELLAGKFVAWNDWVTTPFVGPGKERTGGRRSSGDWCRFDGLQWGDIFHALILHQGEGNLRGQHQEMKQSQCGSSKSGGNAQRGGSNLQWRVLRSEVRGHGRPRTGQVSRTAGPKRSEEPGLVWCKKMLGCEGRFRPKDFGLRMEDRKRL